MLILTMKLDRHNANILGTHNEASPKRSDHMLAINK
jgi:hypothetical protein